MSRPLVRRPPASVGPTSGPMADPPWARLAGVALLTAMATAGAWPAPAGAEEVTQQELVTLARRAADEPAALEKLRSVDRVDGRPVDLARALDGPGPDAAARARALAGEPGPGAADSGAVNPDAGKPGVIGPDGPGTAAEAREAARSILAERRFHARRAPRPFAGVLRRIGGWLRPVGEPVRDVVNAIAGNTVGLLIVAGMAVVLAAAVCVRLARRHAATNLSTRRSARRPTQVGPAELERLADVAEGQNQLDRAFRLRFQAGLLRLHDAGRLRLRSSTTTGEVVRAVPSPALGALATALEEIVYGGRAAAPPDLDAARAGWARVLEEVRR